MSKSEKEKKKEGEEKKKKEGNKTIHSAQATSETPTGEVDQLLPPQAVQPTSDPAPSETQGEVVPSNDEPTIEDTISWIRRRNAAKRNESKRVSVKRASEMPLWPYLRTGVPSLDINYGGIPLGKYVVIYGPKSSGKSTLVLQTLGAAQRAGLRVAIAPSEGTFDKLYSRVNGVDLEKLLVLNDPRLGATGQLIRELVEGGKIDLIAIDSITMMLPEELAKKQVDEDDMAVQARRISRMLTLITPEMTKRNIGVIVVCQVRHQIGGGSPGGPPIEIFPGGNALKHNSCYTIKMTRTPRSYLRNDGKFLGELNLKSFSAVCEKSKSFLIREDKHNSDETAFMFFAYSGLDKERTLFEHAKRVGVLERKGARYQFISKGETNQTVSAAGEVNFVDLLRTDRSVYDRLLNETWRRRIDLVSDRTDIPVNDILGNMEILQ